MSDEPKIPTLIAETVVPTPPTSPAPPSPPQVEQPAAQPAPPSLPEFLASSPATDLSRRLTEEFASIINRHAEVAGRYCCLGLLDSETLLGRYELDRVFEALIEQNGDRSKDVLLVLLNGGGSIEPAYQISKLCKAYARERFLAVIPRYAKSAATLLAIGADEIHMGPLGQLGPIDPQLGRLPALGVSQALKSIAQLSQDYPGSAEMLARYLSMALTVEQIGYCERICESAAQYAERLLTTKQSLPKPAAVIAGELVYEYKDHGFVIDRDEARAHLGNHWVLTNTPELALAEDVYRLFEESNLILSLFRAKYLTIIGHLGRPLIYDKQRQSR
jgi:hypothetical protein